jgi:hypothetical protein
MYEWNEAIKQTIKFGKLSEIIISRILINTSKGNSKATWKIINNMLGKISKNTIIESIEVNDIIQLYTTQ